MAALLVFLSLGVVLSTEALLRSTGASAERAEDRVLRRCIGDDGPRPRPRLKIGRETVRGGKNTESIAEKQWNKKE